jgi:hypothetical protein
VELAFPKPRKAKKQTQLRGEHEHLVGWKDNLARRAEVYRLAGGEVQIEWGETPRDTYVTDLRSANCQGCAETHLTPWDNRYGQWNHGCKFGGKKCSTLSHGQTYECRAAHNRYHGREF